MISMLGLVLSSLDTKLLMGYWYHLKERGEKWIT